MEDKIYQPSEQMKDNPFMLLILLGMLGGSFPTNINMEGVDITDPDWAKKYCDNLGIPPITEEDRKEYMENISQKYSLDETIGFLKMSEKEYYRNSDMYSEMLKKFYGIKGLILPIMEKKLEEVLKKIEEINAKYKMNK